MRLKSIDSVSELGVVILDACRDNPFSKNLNRNLGGRSGSVGRGLTRVQDTPANILVAFSTKEGDIADDGTGEYSPYAEALLEHLPEPGLEIRKLFGKVRDSVMEKTRQRRQQLQLPIQEPYIYGSLGGKDLYLFPPKEPANNAVINNVPATPDQTEEWFETAEDLFHGWSDDPDIPQAMEYYKQAATNGNVKAQYKLGMIFLEGADDVSIDKDQAIRWLQQAADQGHISAQSQIRDLRNY